MDRLKNKIAIVTGAASGMGKSIAELYANEGATVMLADYNLEGAQAVSDELNNQGFTTKALKVNVANAEDINEMFRQTINAFGTYDILVNNAGVMDNFEPVGEVTDENWDRIFDINTKSVMRSMRQAVNYWLAEEKKGIIVNTISTGGLNGAHAGATYGASKHAVTALTKNTAFMYAQKGIRVNGIAPGAVATNIQSSMTGKSEFGMSRTRVAQSVTPRVGQAEDIGKVAVFLGSEESDFVNGTIIVADAGWTAAF